MSNFHIALVANPREKRVAFLQLSLKFKTFVPRIFLFLYPQYCLKVESGKYCEVARLSIILLIGRGLILTESKKVVESASQLDNHWFCPSAPEEMSKPYC